MFAKTIENTSPKRQRVNESQSAHSLALRACKGAEHGDVQLTRNSEQDIQPPGKVQIFWEFHRWVSSDIFRNISEQTSKRGVRV